MHRFSVHSPVESWLMKAGALARNGGRHRVRTKLETRNFPLHDNYIDEVSRGDGPLHHTWPRRCGACESDQSELSIRADRVADE